MATKKLAGDSVRYCHQLISDVMGTMVNANTSTLMANANDKLFRNTIRWAEIRCQPMNNGTITSSLGAQWMSVLKARCSVDATQCTGATLDTLHAKYKFGGTVAATDANKNTLGDDFLEAYLEVFKDHNTAGSPPVSAGDFTTAWTAIKGTNVLAAATAPNACDRGLLYILPATWYASVGWETKTSADNAGVQSVYDATMKAGIEYEINNENFTQGTSQAQSRAEAKAIIVGMNALVITGVTKPGTEYARVRMGAIVVAQYGINEEHIYMDYWRHLIKQYYKNRSVTD